MLILVRTWQLIDLNPDGKPTFFLGQGKTMGDLHGAAYCKVAISNYITNWQTYCTLQVEMIHLNHFTVGLLV